MFSASHSCTKAKTIDCVIIIDVWDMQEADGALEVVEEEVVVVVGLVGETFALSVR